MTVDEGTLESWTRRSSDAEQERQERTERMIQQALESHPPLLTAQLRVYAKGSYPNNTNVRLDSDVDIAVECQDQFYWREDQQGFKTGNSPYRGAWTPEALRSEIERALFNAFPSQIDASGNVAIRVRPSSARSNADVVPCFQFRHYIGPNDSIPGIKIFGRDGRSILNYPQQHYEHGVAKNSATARRYKRVVRILKRTANALHEAGYGETPSFLVESLVFNCDDSAFAQPTWGQRLTAVLASAETTLAADRDATSAYRCVEANCCKFLFSSEQRWNHDTARNFVAMAAAALL